MENVENQKPRTIATIMQKHYIGENSFVYNPIGIIEGEIDPDSNMFRDVDGNEYLDMLNPILAYSKNKYAYYNAIDYDEYRKQFEEDVVTEEEMLKRYQESCDSRFYYVSKKNGDMFNVQLSKDDLLSLYDSYRLDQENIKSIFLKFGENNEVFDFPEDENTEYTFYDEEEEYDEEAEEAAFTQTISEIISGQRSLKELKELREDVMAAKEKTDQLLDTIDLQIEASQNGESPVELKQEVEADVKLDELYKKITKTLINQDAQVIQLITEVDRINNYKNVKQGILITGPTGSGKTKSIELLAKYLDRPLIIVDTTKLTVPGWVGTDLEEILWDLYIQCGRDLKKAENAIIYFDEIDKKGSEKKSDVSGQGVLNILLKFIDGTTYDATGNSLRKKETVKINTKGMTVICGGCFNDVYGDFKQKNPMGFSNLGQEDQEQKEEPTVDDFVKKGMMTRELMRRLPVIIHMNDWTIPSLKKYLNSSDESPIVAHKNIFEENNIAFEVTDAYLDNICQKVLKRGTGPSGLSGQLSVDTRVPYYEMRVNPNKYGKLILDSEPDGKTTYHLIEKEVTKEKPKQKQKQKTLGKKTNGTN